MAVGKVKQILIIKVEYIASDFENGGNNVTKNAGDVKWLRD